ncbi:MAG: hypothetical protein KIT10_14835 [Flavobacteriales bacterium]|nr:hypothetical protein [Flavobacteriales bacterium]
MNTFVSIERLGEFCFKRVTYYSVRLEGRDNTEFEDFLERHEHNENIRTELDELFWWLQEIGTRVGARADYFRPERRAHALPPPSRKLRMVQHKHLRLYCMRISDHVVFLFNGGVKTAATAQECTTVKPHFERANRLALAIDKAIREGDIKLNAKGDRLEFDEDLELAV